MGLRDSQRLNQVLSFLKRRLHRVKRRAPGEAGYACEGVERGSKGGTRLLLDKAIKAQNQGNSCQSQVESSFFTKQLVLFS